VIVAADKRWQTVATTSYRRGTEKVLIVNIRIKVRLDSQAYKSTIVAKVPFFPRVMNPRYRIRGTMCNARSNLISGKALISRGCICM
jgi:hypothetical protein